MLFSGGRGELTFGGEWGVYWGWIFSGGSGGGGGGGGGGWMSKFSATEWGLSPSP